MGSYSWMSSRPPSTTMQSCRPRAVCHSRWMGMAPSASRVFHLDVSSQACQATTRQLCLSAEPKKTTSEIESFGCSLASPGSDRTGNLLAIWCIDPDANHLHMQVNCNSGPQVKRGRKSPRVPEQHACRQAQ